MKIGRLSGCHQRADRSFFYKGYQFPLCARCTGAFIGQLVAIPWVFVLGATPFYLLLLAPMAIDGLTQLSGGRTSNNYLRFITGLLGGFGLVASLVAFVLSLLF